MALIDDYRSAVKEYQSWCANVAKHYNDYTCRLPRWDRTDEVERSRRSRDLIYRRALLSDGEVAAVHTECGFIPLEHS